MNVVLIDGYLATGKSTLRGLLDGYPGFFLSPVQDSLVGGLSHCKNIAELLKEKDMMGLRKLLLQFSNFYYIEHYATVGRLNFHASVDDIAYFDFQFDFGRYEADCMEQLRSLPMWTVENILQAFYSTLPRYWKNHNYETENLKAYITWDMHQDQIPEFFLTHVPNGKLISIRRDAAETVATRIGRRPIADNFRSSSRSLIGIRTQLLANEPHNIVRRHARVAELSRQYPERVCIISFKDMIENTKTTMEQICSFLNVPYDSCLSEVTVNTEKPQLRSTVAFVGKVNDTVESILDPTEQQMLRYDLERTPLWKVIQENPRIGVLLLSVAGQRTLRKLLFKLSDACRQAALKIGLKKS